MRRDVVFQPPLGPEFCTDFLDQLLRRHREIGVLKHPLLHGFVLELTLDRIKGILECCFGNALPLEPKLDKVPGVIEPSRHLFLRQVSLVHCIQDTDEQLFQILLHLGHVGARQTLASVLLRVRMAFSSSVAIACTHLNIVAPAAL